MQEQFPFFFCHVCCGELAMEESTIMKQSESSPLVRQTINYVAGLTGGFVASVAGITYALHSPYFTCLQRSPNTSVVLHNITPPYTHVF